MNRLTIFIQIGLWLLPIMVQGQPGAQPVADLSIKLPSLSEENLYYGFEAGDVILLNFNEGLRKGVKELEVIEYPNNTRFSQFKTRQVADQRIKVEKRGIYQFRLYNSALTKRVCNISIKRLPASEESKGFNTAVAWETKYDTTYHVYEKEVVLGYDTTYKAVEKIELAKTDTVPIELFEKVERVHSETAIGKSNKSILQVTLPANARSEMETRETVSWAYWIGVGEEAQEAYAKANQDFLGTASEAATLIPGSGALISLALTGVSHFAKPSVGDNVNYRFIADYANADAFRSGNSYYSFDRGNGIAASGQSTTPLQGTFYIGLYNDNFREGIDVTVKVVAIQLVKHYEKRTYQVPISTPRTEVQLFRDPVINKSKIPVHVQ